MNRRSFLSALVGAAGARLARDFAPITAWFGTKPVTLPAEFYEDAAKLTAALRALPECDDIASTAWDG